MRPPPNCVEANRKAAHSEPTASAARAKESFDELAVRLLFLIQTNEPLSLAKAAKQLSLSQSVLRRLLMPLSNPEWGGIGFIHFKEIESRTLLHLTVAGRDWIRTHASVRP